MTATCPEVGRCRCVQHYCVICGDQLDPATWIQHECEPTGPRQTALPRDAATTPARRPKPPPAPADPPAPTLTDLAHTGRALARIAWRAWRRRR